MDDEQELKAQVEFAPIVPSADAMKAAVTDALAGQTINRRLPSFRMEYREPADRTIRRWMPVAYMEAARASRGMPDALTMVKAIGCGKCGGKGEVQLALHWEPCECQSDEFKVGDVVQVGHTADVAALMDTDIQAHCDEARDEAQRSVDSAWLITPADLRETFNGKGGGIGEQSGWGGYEDE